MKFKTLLVGAGAVGISYGYYLAQGGAEVAFLVKPKYAADLEAGTHVYFPRKRGLREPFLWKDYRVLTDNAQVAAEPFDAVFLCLSATALRGPWLEPFLASLGPDTTLVMLTPGAEDLTYLSARFPRERIVAGLITLVAWQSPLPGESDHPPGIAIWFPPMTKLPFHGPKSRAEPIVTTMKSGGCPARYRGPDIAPGGTVASAVLTAHVAALEGAGWTFEGLRKSPLSVLASTAAREGMSVLASLQERRPPLFRHLVRRGLMNFGLRLAASRMPFDFEVYLRYHFTKVRDQTAFSLGELVRLGRERGLPVDHIESLRTAVFG
jgi:hypothetical protein